MILKTLVEDEEVCINSVTFFYTYILLMVKDLVFLTSCDLFFLQLMLLLFSFLEAKETHNSLLAGYFSKVFSTQQFFYCQKTENFRLLL